MLRLYADVRWPKLKCTGPKTTLPIELNTQFPAAAKVELRTRLQPKPSLTYITTQLNIPDDHANPRQTFV
jgi:hypothetical protein